jgi:hypothetical protein
MRCTTPACTIRKSSQACLALVPLMPFQEIRVRYSTDHVENMAPHGLSRAISALIRCTALVPVPHSRLS